MRSKTLGLLAAGLLLLVACGDDDGGSADDGALRIVTTEMVEPAVQDLVTAFAEGQDLDVEISTEDPDGVRSALDDDSADVVIAPEVLIRSDTDVRTQPLGSNAAVIAVADGNPQALGPEAFAAENEANTIICTADSRIGNFGVAVLQSAGVTPNADEANDCDESEALGRVAAGELDAALMYSANVEVPEGVELMTIDEEHNIELAIVSVAPQGSDEAAEFSEFLDSEEARTILEEQGYLR